VKPFVLTRANYAVGDDKWACVIHLGYRHSRRCDPFDVYNVADANVPHTDGARSEGTRPASGGQPEAPVGGVAHARGDIHAASDVSGALPRSVVVATVGDIHRLWINLWIIVGRWRGRWGDNALSALQVPPSGIAIGFALISCGLLGGDVLIASFLDSQIIRGLRVLWEIDKLKGKPDC
jgi:hypothetical protein